MRRLVALGMADASINMRGVSAAKLGDRAVFYLAFDSAADSDKAQAALKKSLAG